MCWGSEDRRWADSGRCGLSNFFSADLDADGHALVFDDVLLVTADEDLHSLFLLSLDRD
jgi:hypothetical protein